VSQAPDMAQVKGFYGHGNFILLWAFWRYPSKIHSQSSTIIVADPERVALIRRGRLVIRGARGLTKPGLPATKICLSCQLTLICASDAIFETASESGLTKLDVLHFTAPALLDGPTVHSRFARRCEAQRRLHLPFLTRCRGARHAEDLRLPHGSAPRVRDHRANGGIPHGLSRRRCDSSYLHY
jgi:hypothetical protein